VRKGDVVSRKAVEADVEGKKEAKKKGEEVGCLIPAGRKTVRPSLEATRVDTRLGRKEEGKSTKISGEVVSREKQAEGKHSVLRGLGDDCRPQREGEVCRSRPKDTRLPIRTVLQRRAGNTARTGPASCQRKEERLEV